MTCWSTLALIVFQSVAVGLIVYLDPLTIAAASVKNVQYQNPTWLIIFWPRVSDLNPIFIVWPIIYVCPLSSQLVLMQSEEILRSHQPSQSAEHKSFLARSRCVCLIHFVVRLFLIPRIINCTVAAFFLQYAQWRDQGRTEARRANLPEGDVNICLLVSFLF